MSLNRFEQTMFDYWESHPDERRHWQMKTGEALRRFPGGEAARSLERELWDYLRERSEHVADLRRLLGANPPRISLLNLAEYMVRVWGPPPPKKLSVP